jgi:hypothetical protein
MTTRIRSCPEGAPDRSRPALTLAGPPVTNAPPHVAAYSTAESPTQGGSKWTRTTAPTSV